MLGVGGRLAMALIQAARGFPTQWSVAGTWQVVAPGLFLGPAAGLLLDLCRPWLPATTVRRGLGFGFLHGCFWVAVYCLRPAGPVEASAAPLLAGVLFALLLLGFGVVLAVLEERWRPALDRWRAPTAVRAVLWIAAAAGLAMTLWVLLTR